MYGLDTLHECHYGGGGYIQWTGCTFWAVSDFSWTQSMDENKTKSTLYNLVDILCDVCHCYPSRKRKTSVLVREHKARIWDWVQWTNVTWMYWQFFFRICTAMFAMFAKVAKKAVLKPDGGDGWLLRRAEGRWKEFEQKDKMELKLLFWQNNFSFLLGFSFFAQLWILVKLEGVSKIYWGVSFKEKNCQNSYSPGSQISSL